MRVKLKAGPLAGDIMNMADDAAEMAIRSGTAERADDPAPEASADTSGSQPFGPYAPMEPVAIEQPRRSAKVSADEARRGEDGQPGEDLEGMTKAELTALATERGVDLPAGATKADIVIAIEAAGRQ